MAGRRTTVVRAVPVRLRFGDKTGYTLTVKVVDGPASMLNRVLVVSLTGDQLDSIAEFEPKVGDSGEAFGILEF